MFVEIYRPSRIFGVQVYTIWSSQRSTTISFSPCNGEQGCAKEVGQGKNIIEKRTFQTYTAWTVLLQTYWKLYASLKNDI